MSLALSHHDCSEARRLNLSFFLIFRQLCIFLWGFSGNIAHNWSLFNSCIAPYFLYYRILFSNRNLSLSDLRNSMECLSVASDQLHETPVVVSQSIFTNHEVK